jgi:bifunctional non-homologous end joining protein LigD
VIAGYVPSTVDKAAVGSLVLGYHRDGKLMQAGRVGTGFSRAVARDLRARLDPLARKTPPFADKPDAAARRGVTWVKPDLVVEVEFRAWTADGLLRHAAFRGLREDKPAKDIVREAEGRAEVQPPARPQVRLTHPDRVYWPDAGVTKQGLADYYSEVWPRMAPHVVNRPLALLRCPGGTSGQCFFQKHAWKGQSREIVTFDDPLDDSDDPLIAIDGLPGLIGLVQGGALEIHGWQSTLDDLEHPDQIVMDLDPGEGVPWTEVIDAAREVKARLEDAGLATFVKTTGGKGLHVVVPLLRRQDWEPVRRFCETFARQMAAASPRRFTANMAKAQRRGRIYLDYLRNVRGATAVAAYSLRARPGVPASTPLAWEELPRLDDPADLNYATVPERLAAGTPDPWAGIDQSARALTKSIERKLQQRAR